MTYTWILDRSHNSLKTKPSTQWTNYNNIGASAKNGVGIPEGFDWQNSDSLGLKLIKMLAENQLDGSVGMEPNSALNSTSKPDFCFDDGVRHRRLRQNSFKLPFTINSIN